jgi:hypothetical protein
LLLIPRSEEELKPPHCGQCGRNIPSDSTSPGRGEINASSGRAAVLFVSNCVIVHRSATRTHQHHEVSKSGELILLISKLIYLVTEFDEKDAQFYSDGN